MADQFRELCEELLRELQNAIAVLYGEDGTHHISAADAVITKTDAALAQPEPEGPSDEELREMFNENDWNHISPETFEDIARTVLVQWGRPTPLPVAEGPTTAELMNLSAACNSPSVFARAVLARWGRPTPQPVAVSERPWERAGWCDEQGRCWLRRRYEEDGVTWRLMAPSSVFDDAMPIYYAEALPAHALPTPEAKT